MITKTIHALTLEQKVGQLLMVGFQGKDLSKNDAALLRKIKPGGIVFYARNTTSPSDIPSVVSKINTLLKDPGIPLFFAVDQEGGIVHRIKGEYYKPPSAPAIGAANSEAIAEKIGSLVGTALGNLGINVNLAPVLDVPDIKYSTMTLRSYSNNPEVVERMGTAYIRGLRSAGILATAKHFPGIGQAYGDTHETLPHIVWNTEKERESDLLPFRSAIEAGSDIVMAGHVIAEPGDGKRPVSLSSYWLHDMLRNALGFQGLILIDNIEMKPVLDYMDVGKAAVESFKAGADIIMVSHEQRNQEAVYQALLDAVKTGGIPVARVEESLRRILRAKTRIHDAKVMRKNTEDFCSIRSTVDESSVIGLRRKDTIPRDIGGNESVLYIGFDSNLFDSLKQLYKNAKLMNSSVSHYQAIYRHTTFDTLLGRFDMVVLDSHYSDISGVIKLCRGLDKRYMVFQQRLNRLENTLQTLRPEAVIVMLDHTRESYQIAAEIIKGTRKTKGVLPFETPYTALYNVF